MSTITEYFHYPKNQNHRDVEFSNWLPSFSNMCLSFFHASLWLDSSFFLFLCILWIAILYKILQYFLPVYGLFFIFLTFYVFIKKVDRILYLEITWRLAVLKDHVKRTWKPSVRGSQGPNMEPFELQ